MDLFFQEVKERAMDDEKKENGLKDALAAEVRKKKQRKKERN